MKRSISGALAILVTGVAFAMVYGCTPNPKIKTSGDTEGKTPGQSEIRIGGSSSTYPMVKVLADAYAIKDKNNQMKTLPPNQSEGVIAGVKEGLLDIGGISKQLKSEDNDGTLEYREAAQDALLVATHPSVTGVTNLTTEHLKAIYSGKISNWKDFGGPDAKIVVLDRPEDESAKRLLRKYFLGDQLKNSPDAVILRQESDLIAALQNTKYSIGAFSLANAISNKLPVKHLSLNDVEPTPENVDVGKYQMVRHIGIISKKTPKQPVLNFIDFTKSPEGISALRKSGFVPSKQK
jgi:phosphate transport system substrate-binding protein